MPGCGSTEIFSTAGLLAMHRLDKHPPNGDGRGSRPYPAPYQNAEAPVSSRGILAWTLTSVKSTTDERRQYTGCERGKASAYPVACPVSGCNSRLLFVGPGALPKHLEDSSRRWSQHALDEQAAATYLEAVESAAQTANDREGVNEAQV